MREVIVRIKDDLDHELVADKTIPFAFDGQSYEIDLTAEHVDEFAADMARWIAVARRVKRHHRAKPVTANGQPEQVVTKRHKKAEQAGKALRDKVRAYAQEHGIKQAGTGYLRQESIDAWLEVHPRDAAALGRTP